MPRVTDILGRYHVSNFSVCREGTVIALHLGTPKGTIIGVMTEKEFTKAARGDVDSNGVPFRPIEEIYASASKKEAVI